LWNAFFYLYVEYEERHHPELCNDGSLGPSSGCGDYWRPGPLDGDPTGIPLFLILLVSALGAGFGQRRLRTVMLATVTVPAAILVRDYVAVWLDPYYVYLRWSASIETLCFLAWAALNFWYFLGPPSRAFYPKVQHGFGTYSGF
jgi:hypothetical protein